MIPNLPPPASSNDSPPLNHEPSEQKGADLASIETLLTDGQIINVQNAALWGSNYALLVIVRNAALEAPAVYKPQRGERPLWDFPDGTLCHREVASYEVSQALGWQLVPPTVLRHDGPYGRGSLQLFIRHNPEVAYFSLDERFDAQLRQYSLFDFIANNADRKGGHLLLETSGQKLWGIDHGLTFSATPKLRTVIWDFAGEEIETRLLHDIQNLHKMLVSASSDLRQKLDRLLNPGEIQALIRRVQALLDRKQYPEPGPGRNHPWPPV